MPDITVHVTLLSKFREFSDKLQNGQAIIPYGTTARELGESLGIPGKFIIILLINGKQGSPADILHDGDSILYVPPAVGGG